LQGSEAECGRGLPRSSKRPGQADKAGLAGISALPAAKDLFDGMRAFVPIAKALS